MVSVPKDGKNDSVHYFILGYCMVGTLACYVKNLVAKRVHLDAVSDTVRIGEMIMATPKLT